MIALLTPTGARPQQIQYCTEYMKHQDYQGEVLWVLVDDVVPSTIQGIPEDFRLGWTLLKVYPSVKWRGLNSQASNLLAGINALKSYVKKLEAIFIIEDDDWYSPVYLRYMLEMLKGCSVAGETRTVYYNIPCRGYRVNGNVEHSSLFQTCFTPDLLPLFETICVTRQKFIDMHFFRSVGKQKVNLFWAPRPLAIGIKGLPGRRGIGAGHSPRTNLNPDTDFSMLKSYIGEDYKHYIKYEPAYIHNGR